MNFIAYGIAICLTGVETRIPCCRSNTFSTTTVDGGEDIPLEVDMGSLAAPTVYSLPHFCHEREIQTYCAQYLLQLPVYTSIGKAMLV